MSSYIQLTNRLLRRLNEVEIASADFNSVKGVQALAKDAIQDSVRSINTVDFEWPFNAAEATTLLTVGQEEYVWPTNFKVVEWDSFQVLKDDTLGVVTTPLSFISREEWYAYLRSKDTDSGLEGLSVPKHVFPSHGNGFGITPSPDKAYMVRYRYFKSPALLVNATDSVVIPEMFDNVIIEGGVYYMYMFRDNSEQAQIAEQTYFRSLAGMERLLIHKFDRVRGSIITRGRHA